MSLLHSNGTVRHASLPIKRATSSSNFGNNDVYLARIDEVVYIDDERNTTKDSINKRVQYNVTVLEGKKSGSQIFAVTDGQSSGDGLNLSQKVRRATTKKFKGPAADNPKGTDGEYVLVSFIGGSLMAPVITGTISHPANSAFAPTKADGLRSISEFNGIRTSVDKSGNYTIANMGGPRNNDGTYSDTTAGGTFLKVGANGDIILSDGAQTFSIVKNTSCAIDSKKIEMTSSGEVNISASSTATIDGGGSLNLTGGAVNIAGGGPPCARVSDTVVVTGMDSGGNTHTLYGQIITGSGVTLVGG